MSRWRREPQWLQGIVAALVLILLYGTAVHIVQLVAADGEPYPGLPQWLRLCFVSLTALNPLAVLLLLRRYRAGVSFAVAVLVTDAFANALANYVFDQAVGLTVGRVGQAVITLLALASLAALPALWRATAKRKRVR